MVLKVDHRSIISGLMNVEGNVRINQNETSQLHVKELWHFSWNSKGGQK